MIQLSTDKGYFTTINCGFDKEYNPLMEYLDYAKRLKSLQVAQGIKTQIELSAWMGFSKSIVSAWMRGEKIPSMDTALKIADMFGVCVEWLLTGKGLKHPDDTPVLQNYINVTDLTPAQIQETNDFIAFKRSQNLPKITENNTNKALTTPAKNVGGGVNLAIDRRVTDRLIKEGNLERRRFLDELATEQDRCVMERHAEEVEANKRYVEMVKTKCRDNECYCEPPCATAADHTKNMSFNDVLAYARRKDD